MFIFRSLTVERHHFYTNQKTLIHDVIMYHLRVHREKLRIAIATFAVNVDVIVDGISQGKPQVTKCDLFNDNGKAYWNNVIYNVTYNLSDGEYTLDYKGVNGASWIKLSEKHMLFLHQV